MAKKFFRCTVCNDVHYGVKPPEICPTCGAKNAYVRVEKEEAEVVQGFLEDIAGIEGEATGKGELRELFWKFAEGQEYELNPDEDHLNKVLEGIYTNEKDTGLKFCPCQLRSGDLQKDLKLLCPCNFEVQETYKGQERCWCGLFTKRAIEVKHTSQTE